MVVTEIVLILIGVIAFAASFFVTEKLSAKDLNQITLMSESDLKVIARKQADDVKKQVEYAVEEMIEDSVSAAKRGLEKESNRKIMAVSEYSDTVMDEMNKTHNEIMFLYTMLRDKQTEASNMVRDLQKITKQIREMDLEHTLMKNSVVKAPAINVENDSVVKPVSEEPVEKNIIEMDENAEMDMSQQILLLYKEGKDEVEIARILDCGLGVVRLVLGLYHET